MKQIQFVLGGCILAAAFVNGCVAGEDAPYGPDGSMLEKGAPSATKSLKLNLSHIECTEDGDVLAHFVLLFAGSATPGDLTGTYNGGSFGPVSPSKNSGNVWHYNVILPAGEIDILSAQVTAKGTLVTLHNPSEYAGDYWCGPEEPECPAAVEPTALLCVDHPFGNPGAECGHFGLLPQGKDDNLSGTTFVSTQDAYVAIVKSGIGACNPGQSAYAVYVNVSAGDILATPTGDQAISHVTYCACPDTSE